MPKGQAEGTARAVACLRTLPNLSEGKRGGHQWRMGAGEGQVEQRSNTICQTSGKNGSDCSALGPIRHEVGTEEMLSQCQRAVLPSRSGQSSSASKSLALKGFRTHFLSPHPQQTPCQIICSQSWGETDQQSAKAHGVGGAPST